MDEFCSTRWTAGLLLIFLLCLACGNPKNEPDDKPNVIILFADDLGYGDLGTFGHPTIHTPNLDRMASRGMKFTQFYSASPACTASRYALLTGKYPVRSGFGWVLYPASERGIHPSEKLISEYLKEIGYSTACFGKWHLGTTQAAFHPLRNGFDEYYGLPYSNDMIPPKWPEIPLLHNYDTIQLGPDQSSLTREYSNRAIQFISDNRDQPFFIYLPYTMPHIPLFPGDDFSESKRGLYGDVVEELDWSVARIIKALEDLDLHKKTLVLFTSDNGPWIIKGTQGGSAGLLRDGKGSTWEGGMRVPAIAYWPDVIAAGTINREVVSTIDILPTVLGLAGYKIETTVDGIDIRTSLLEGERGNTDRQFFYYGLGNELFGMREGKWKIHFKIYSQTGQQYFDKPLPLLFNLEEDPSELYEISAEHPEIVIHLENLAESHRQEVKETGSFFSE